MKSDGGSNALRGLKVQTLIALLESLKLNPPGLTKPTLPWTEITLEPKLETSKVDLVWKYSNEQAKVIQVKSTANAFGTSDVEKWAKELLDWDGIPGIKYELWLVGQAANDKTATMDEVVLEKDGSRVCQIRRMNLDLDAFRLQAAQLVALFMKNCCGEKTVDPDKCATFVRNVETMFDDQAIRRENIDSAALIELIRQWFIPDPPRQLPVIRVFLSAPEDVSTFAAAGVDLAIHSFNQHDSQKQGVRFERVEWNTVATDEEWRPRPVDSGLGRCRDLFVAVLETRLGEAGGRRGTASREELERAAEYWKGHTPGSVVFAFARVTVSSDEPELMEQMLELANLQKQLRTSKPHVLVLKYEPKLSESLRNTIRDHLLLIARPFSPISRGVTPQVADGAKAKPTAESAAITKYLAQLIEDTKVLRLIGLGHAAKHLSIDQAFVPMRVLFDRREDNRPRGRVADVESTWNVPVSLDEIFRCAVTMHRRAVVLLGEPGAGKTTAARQLAWSLAVGKRSPEMFALPAGTIPVLLRLRDFAAELALKENPLEQFLHAATGTGELWASSPLLWIFDGLDEVFDTSLRQSLAKSLRSIVIERTKDYFLVTSRYHGYFDDEVPLGDRFVTFDVANLEETEMRGFVSQWFAAVAESEVTKDRSALQAEKGAKAQALSDLLNSAESAPQKLRELARNPLMLTLLCLIYDEREDLPHNRADLYAECIKVLLEHWRRQLRVTKKFDPEAAIDVLSELAWELQAVGQKLNAPREELRQIAVKHLQTLNPKAGLGTDGDAFLDLMLREVGILAMGGGVSDSCGFLHRTFQESLAARYATKHGKAREMAVAAASAQDDWWHETVLVSLRDETYCLQFFREMLAAGIAEKQADLADRCLNEAKYFFADPFIEVLNDPHVPPERVAAVMRMLKSRGLRLPGLGDIVKRLVAQRFPESPQTQQTIRDFAAEILAQLGETMPSDHSGRIWVDSRTKLTFMAIPAGRFKMGGIQEVDERPIHEVRITRDFWLAKYPVTNEQYGLFLKAQGGQVPPPGYWEDRRFNQPNQPVVGVSWHEAQQYCQWAGGRLPTEAEWEYSCRAGTTTEYWFGDDTAQLDTYAWFRENSEGRTRPVGDRPGNPWGLFDMHGNVWEWCQDWYSEGYYANSPKEDPQGPNKASLRVVRGGGWIIDAARCRSAYRSWSDPGRRYDDRGFRVALSSIPDR